MRSAPPRPWLGPIACRDRRKELGFVRKPSGSSWRRRRTRVARLPSPWRCSRCAAFRPADLLTLLTGRRRAVFQVRELPAGRRLQVPRRIQRAGPVQPQQRKAAVVTFSSGNHAQAVALPPACWVSGPHRDAQDAPAVKAAATRGYGADAVLYDRYKENREAIGASSRRQGLTLIPPYDHPHIMAGQGTAAKELFEEVGALPLSLPPPPDRPLPRSSRPPPPASPQARLAGWMRRGAGRRPRPAPAPPYPAVRRVRVMRRIASSASATTASQLAEPPALQPPSSSLPLRRLLHTGAAHGHVERRAGRVVARDGQGAGVGAHRRRGVGGGHGHGLAAGGDVESRR